MFILGMMSVFVGISLLAPDESKGNLIMVATNFQDLEDKDWNLFRNISGGEIKDNSSLVSEVSSTEVDRYAAFFDIL